MNKKIGPYQLIRSIAKGGMGEVFLAYDPHCRREIALKCIRSEYLENKTIYRRFVKEAHIASQLTHPNIIPIYNLSKEGALPYYTMPFIDGKNLKQILVEALQQEKDPQNIGTPEGSIQSLTRIFLTICEAVSYAHQQQIIHRDLKPENILVGKYGEVLIFDWGVADKLQNISKEDPSYQIEELDYSNLTSPGKIIGTLSFLAPERFEGAPANYQTDIYSLGVMLYMILTLKLPFLRKKLKETKKNLHKEVLKNPIEVAPYRDIPHPLVNITQKCLAKNPLDRYESMADLLSDLKNFVRGSSEWVEKKPLHFFNKEDWAFHENILISKHQAISERKDTFEWICMMVSKEPYALNTKLELNITMGEHCSGVGLMLNASKAQDRAYPFEGYEVWLSCKGSRPSKLFRNSIELLPLPHLHLEPNKSYRIQFEQLDNRMQLHINGVQQFSYLTYLTLLGKHVGLTYRDADFKIDSIRVFSSSPSLVISCLEVPKAFLANKHFDKALIEYRRIGHAFPGRHESREAFFRGGLALIEKAETLSIKSQVQKTLDQAIHEFENLRNTPGAPLEYLGKALVYRALNEVEEELKCLELTIRRYPKHPLLYLVYDYIIYRMYQSSHTDRLATHEFILLALRYNSYAQRPQMIDPFILNIADKKGVYFFLSKLPDGSTEKEQVLSIILNLAFLLGKPYVLGECLDLCVHPTLMKNAVTALTLLHKSNRDYPSTDNLDQKDADLADLIKKKPSKTVFDEFFAIVKKQSTEFAEKVLFILLDHSFFLGKTKLMEYVFDKLHETKLPIQQKESLNKLILEKDLVTQNFDRAAKYIQLAKYKTPQVHFDHKFLEGCYLHATESAKKSLEYFSNELTSSSPKLETLAPLFLTKRLNLAKWSKSAFSFEFMTLYRQLYIYYQSAQSETKAQYFHEKWKEYSYYG